MPINIDLNEAEESVVRLDETVELKPADLGQCQAEKPPPGASFMTLGPISLKRCTNVPVVIAREVNPGKDGLRGTMSLCAECKKQFLKQLGPDYATFEDIGWSEEEAAALGGEDLK